MGKRIYIAFGRKATKTGIPKSKTAVWGTMRSCRVAAGGTAAGMLQSLCTILALYALFAAFAAAIITTAEKNGKELEIFSVALGDSTHYEFNADALIALSTNESCVTAGDTNTLLNKFKEIHSEATDNTATKYSVNGKVTIGEASKNIIVPGTSTVNDMDDSITVKYMDGETEKTLFECTSSTQLQGYGLSIEGKYIYWDVNEYIRKQNITKLPTNIFKLKYHIPLK